MMIGLGENARTSLRFLKDRSGNFGVMTALLLPVSLAAAGVAMDLTKLVQVKGALQDAADSAALAAATGMSGKGLTDAEAIALAKQFMAAQTANSVAPSADELGLTEEEMQAKLEEAAVGMVERTPNGSGEIYDVTVNGYYDVPMTPLTRLLGYETVRVNVSSSAQSATAETKNPLSMYMVLDRSGSMGENTNETYTGTCYSRKGKAYSCTKYYTKIEALKLAVNDLATQLDTADPDAKYVRTAAVSYNSYMQTPTSFAWGTTGVVSYVNALTATGGTDSSSAMATAYNALAGSGENTAHQKMNGETSPSKFIVFMTDGDNNYTSADTATKKTCDSAKTAGIEIYTIAFMAPDRGQALLQYCATDTSHYFDAQNAADLVAAFKEIGEKATETMTRLTN